MLSEDEAKELCQRDAEQRGWTWSDPVRVKMRRTFLLWGRVTTYEILSNADRKGANAKFVVDAHSGEVLDARFLPR